MRFAPSGRVAALLAGAVILVVLIVGWAVMVAPERSKASDLNNQIGTAKAQIVATQAYVASPVARRSVRDLRRLQKVLPDEAAAPQILRQLNAAARQARISIDSVTPEPIVPSGGAQAVPITLVVEGHYFGIAKFVHLVRTQVKVNKSTIQGKGRLYSIDSIGLAGASPGTTTAGTTSNAGANTITATIALNAFVNGTGTPTAPAATATPDAASSS